MHSVAVVEGKVRVTFDLRGQLSTSLGL